MRSFPHDRCQSKAHIRTGTCWFIVLFFSGVFLYSVGLVAAPKATTQQSQPVSLAKDVQPFLKAHCIRCHGAERAKAGFRVDQLPTDFHAPKAADLWNEVMDKINLGEMPPADEPQPKPTEFDPVVRWINL